MLDHDNQSPDDHAHTLLWLFARVIDFIAKRSTMDERTRRFRWEDLFNHLAQWATLGSENTRAIVDVDPCQGGNYDQPTQACFPTIIFSTNSSGGPPLI